MFDLAGQCEVRPLGRGRPQSQQGGAEAPCSSLTTRRVGGVGTAAGSVLLNADHVHEFDIATVHRVRPSPRVISTRSAA